MQHDPTQDALNDLLVNFLDDLVQKMADRAEKEEVRVSARIMLKWRRIQSAAQKFTGFAGDKTGNTSLETLKAADAAMEAALNTLTGFLDEHPAPEKTIFDHI